MTTLWLILIALLYSGATFLWLARYYYRALGAPHSEMDGAMAAMAGLLGPIWFPFYVVGLGLRRMFGS